MQNVPNRSFNGLTCWQLVITTVLLTYKCKNIQNIVNEHVGDINVNTPLVSNLHHLKLVDADIFSSSIAHII